MQVDLKKLKPIGIVLILGFSIVALILCFTADMGVPDPYEPLHETDYYRQSESTLLELADELEEQVFPNTEGDETCQVNLDTMTLDIQTDAKQVKKLTAVLERDFGEGLFTVTAAQ